jgi:hypothetical protein
MKLAAATILLVAAFTVVDSAAALIPPQWKTGSGSLSLKLTQYRKTEGANASGYAPGGRVSFHCE